MSGNNTGIPVNDSPERKKELLRGVGFGEGQIADILKPPQKDSAAGGIITHQTPEKVVFIPVQKIDTEMYPASPKTIDNSIKKLQG